RVLDVGEQSDDLIHLVKTEGKTGRYCTLSHCWGPVDQRPLCATTENEVQLFNGITRSDLPKTFQQAVDVARGLHIRYLWIDSLCILQDSDSHWRSQSARMGAIYEEAFLRLAASWARHSAEGLFWTGPSRQPQPVQFPYQSDSSDSSKSIYIWAPEDDVDIRSQSLASRAWAFQESRLARRTIYFSQSHVSWACRKTILNERNCQLYNDFRGTSNTWSSWPIIVLEYSQCELTYETDRLIALQGLANEIANRSKDKYHNGIFLGDLPKQLLWRVGFAGGMQGLPELPSWSWA
ncbi:HET-domain-containing protein, partial [Polyplosphaeria fusca]